MFTQCPSCSTVYEVSANDLAVGRGKVRCGFCETTFDALLTLSEDAPLHGTTLSGLPTLDALTRADDSPPEGEQAIVADTPQAEPAPPAPAEPEGPPQHGAPESVEPAVPATAPPPALAEEAQAKADEPPSQRFVIIDAAGMAADASAAPAPDRTDTLDLEVMPFPRATTAARVGWSTAALLMALALAVQVVHRNRDQLLMRPAIAPYLHRIYDALGIELDPHWEVGRYELIRRPELSSERSADGEHAQLRLAATLMNRASRPQPYPLIRLTLEDRWGSALAGRDFAPSEYLRDTARAAGMLAPGERTPVNLLVIDPGADTVGFTLDICLADSGGAVHCASDASGS